MTMSPSLESNYNHTKLRTKGCASSVSGMCTVCTEQCTGLCEIGLSAVRGAEATYPYETTTQQFASEKHYPFDYSHFNINGRVFGAVGATGDPATVNVYSANLETVIGQEYPIKMKAPFSLPAIAKLNWQDYFAGAAMYGIPAVIGESAIKSGTDTTYDHGKVAQAPVLNRMVAAYREYQSEYGDIILQVNPDDIALGVPEYAIRNTDVKCIEIKFGQAAKGIQHMVMVPTLEQAIELTRQGWFVHPNPMDYQVMEEYRKNKSFHFYQYGRLPMWTEASIKNEIDKYRNMGIQNIFFKMAGYEEADIRRVLQMASENHVTMVTFDGAGGGTGHSPCKMMDEWGLPTIELEQKVYEIMAAMKQQGRFLPAIAMAGGFSSEDRIFKALALGEQYITITAIGRAAMAAAMSGRKVGELIASGMVPKEYQKFGTSVEEIFSEASLLNHRYGREVRPGAIGLYSYLDRLGIGLQQLMTLNRKFQLTDLNRTDLIALTREAKELLAR